MGMNLSGIVDYSTEMPFNNLMHNCREWYPQDSGGWNYRLDAIKLMQFRTDGYPIKSPQKVNGFATPQKLTTIWGYTSAWKTGTYSVNYDGHGSLSFQGTGKVNHPSSNEYTFAFDSSMLGNVISLSIEYSDKTDPVHNIRVLLPGTDTLKYNSEIFNPDWVRRLDKFNTIRFMDWGHTNAWGDTSSSYTSFLNEEKDTTRFDWNSRADLNHYTWANSKGVPYEIMIKAMNSLHKDGWVCVPFNASDNYIRNMAKLFKDSLLSGRKLYIEYSNENWNWGFMQAQWLYQTGCVAKSKNWPEGIVPYIQNCMDIWTQVFSGQLNRIVRVVGVQAGWQDVSNKIVFGMKKGSFDAFAPAAYFSMSIHGEAHFDSLGASCTVKDIANDVRKFAMATCFSWLKSQKKNIADSLHIPMILYEGGQSLVPTPFGVAPTYFNALLDIQRDTSMYNIYQQWMDSLRTLGDGSNPILFNHYSLATPRSEKYGSWGCLETINQDLSKVYAPKYKAITENIHQCSINTGIESAPQTDKIRLYPNPSNSIVYLYPSLDMDVKIFGADGKLYGEHHLVREINISSLPVGIYFIRVSNTNKSINSIQKLIKM